MSCPETDLDWIKRPCVNCGEAFHGRIHESRKLCLRCETKAAELLRAARAATQ